MSLQKQILAVDAGGRPLTWLTRKKAASVIYTNSALWSFGDVISEVRGGVNRLTGSTSVIELHPVIAIKNALADRHFRSGPALTNDNLFARDHYTCMYCGTRHSKGSLSRDHIIPQCQNGPDIWENVVTACLRCNTDLKGGMTPEEAGLELLAVPYAPNHAEMLILKGRRVLHDQMEFLKPFVPKERRNMH